MTDLHAGDRYADLGVAIDAWLEEWSIDNPLLMSIERGTSDNTSLGERRWYLRLQGDDKDFITIWLTLGQRTLRYETYVMPAPEDNVEAVMAMLLRRNDQLVGAHFSIGAEDAVYLRGELPDRALSLDELDRVIGTMYQAVESNFRPLLQLAFASRFSGA